MVRRMVHRFIGARTGGHGAESDLGRKTGRVSGPFPSDGEVFRVAAAALDPPGLPLGTTTGRRLSAPGETRIGRPAPYDPPLIHSMSAAVATRSSALP